MGPLDSLVLVAGIMSSAAALLFRQLALPLPPWREARAVLSRWAAAEGDGYEDATLPPEVSKPS